MMDANTQHLFQGLLDLAELLGQNRVIAVFPGLSEQSKTETAERIREIEALMARHKTEFLSQFPG